jgi:DNA repair exonuclease SbcCD ATPase subunit
VAPIKDLLSTFNLIRESLISTKRSLTTKFTKHHEGAIPEEKGEIKELYEKRALKIESLETRVSAHVAPLNERQSQVETAIQKFKSEISEISALYTEDLEETRKEFEEEKAILEAEQRKLIAETRANHQKAVEAGRKELDTARKTLENLKAAKEAEKHRKAKEKEEEKEEGDDNSSSDEEEEEEEPGEPDVEYSRKRKGVQKSSNRFADFGREKFCKQKGSADRCYSAGFGGYADSMRVTAMCEEMLFIPPPPKHLEKFKKNLETIDSEVAAQEGRLESAEREVVELPSLDEVDTEGKRVVSEATREIRKVSEKFEPVREQKIQSDREQKRSSTSSRRQELATAAQKPAKVRAASQGGSFLQPVADQLLNSDVDGAYAAYIAEREKENNKDSPSFYIYNARLFHEVCKKIYSRQI